MKQRFDGMLPTGQLIAYRLNGHYDFRGSPSRPGELRSAGILESKSLTSEQASGLRSILASKETFGGEGARCFIPGIGFTFGNSGEVVEVLICLQCKWSYFFRGELQMVEALSEAGHHQLAKIYTQLFPGNDPNLA